MPTSADARTRIPGLVLGCALASTALFARAEESAGGHIALTTDYILRGVSQTRGAPALQADLHFANAQGWFLGAWVSTVDLNSGPGATVELNAYGGRSWPVSAAWSARLAAVHYAYPNDTSALRYDYDELAASLSFHDRLSASIAWSPNTSRYSRYRIARDRTALTYDLVGRWPIAGPLSAAGGIGYYDLENLFDSGYGYWSASLIWELPRLQFEIGCYSAGDRAAELFGRETTGQRWSLTATWQFQAMR